MALKVFSVPVFLVVFRETLETAIIVSVLLAFLKQTLDGPNRDSKAYKALCKQVIARRPVFPPINKLTRNFFSGLAGRWNWIHDLPRRCWCHHWRLLHCWPRCLGSP